MTKTQEQKIVSYLTEKLKTQYIPNLSTISRKNLNIQLAKYVDELQTKEYINYWYINRAVYYTIVDSNRFYEAQICEILSFLKTLISIKVLNNYIEQYSDILVKEAVQFFTTKRPPITKNTRNDLGRYFYNKEELNKFLKLYKEQTGDTTLSNIHIGKVEDFDFCVEVIHKYVWKNYNEYSYAYCDYIK